MTRDIIIKQINSCLKLVRTEYGLNQDKMAAILGISKKTLVESEKGRRELGWTEAVALASIFAGSRILKDALGEDFNEMISALALEDVRLDHPPTMGGKVWWREIGSVSGYRIQQNLISSHYRLLDDKDRRLVSSFNIKDIEDYLERL